MIKKYPLFWGITWFLGEQKGGSEVTESQKGRPLKILENFRWETYSNLLGKWIHGGVMFMGSLQRNNIQRGDRLNFTVFNPNPPTPHPLPPPIVLWRSRYRRRLVFVRSLCSSACAFYRIPRNAKTVSRAENILNFLFHFQRSNNAHYLRVIKIPQNNKPATLKPRRHSDQGSVWFSSIWFWFQIENWKSKIHNRDFQCLIPQELKITNLQSQLSIFVSKKHKIEKQFSMFWKSKIENWKWSVGGFYFLFLRKRKTKR